MLLDIKFGLMLLWKQKGFTISALLTLALCIGANAAVFTVLNTVVLRALPFPDADRLVMMYNIYPGAGVSERGANAVPDYLDRQKLTDVFEEIALIGTSGYDMGSEGGARRIDGQYVTPSFFRVLKTKPILGRTFTDQEAIQGNEHVAILSESLWEEMFGRSADVLGRDIRLSGIPYSIVGVVPDAYNVIARGRKLWVPFAFTPQQTSDDSRYTDNWAMIASLRPGSTVAYAKQRIDALNEENLNRFPKYKSMLETSRFQTKVVRIKDQMVRGIKEVLFLLQFAVLGVLLIGCVNLANLMLVRTSARLKELSVRFSLGAGRWRLCRQLLTESLIISVLGGVLALGVGFEGVRLLLALGADQLPRSANMHIDGSVLAFTMVISVLTGLACGAIPLLYVMRRDLNEIFRGNERGGTAGRHALWLRSTLVVTQVSGAFVLLIVSGLLTLSFMKLLTVKPGFSPESIATARFTLPRNRYAEDSQRRNFVASLLERVGSIPGVKSAGVTTYLPFSGSIHANAIAIEGHTLEPGELPPVPGSNTVNGGYLQTMGIPLLAGRNFSDSDGPTSMRVALVDQFMARKYWPNGDPIGAKIHEIDSNDLYTIVGIVGSVKTSDLAEENPVGQVYYHYAQVAPDNMHMVLRGETASIPLRDAMRRGLSQVDPELALFDVKMMPERIAESLLDRQSLVVLCSIFAGLALLLSAVGIYGVLAYNVSQRTREIGIRMALGAGARDVLRMILGQGVKVTVIGLTIGLAIALLLTQAMSSLLYGVKPYDPLVFFLTGGLLAFVALLASFVPSMRAVLIQPSEALRHD